MTRPPLRARLTAWAKTLKTEIAVVAIAARDPRVPWPAKALALATVAYALSPIDLIPDFVPVLGLVDDLIIVPAGIWLTFRLVPADSRGRRASAGRRQRPRSGEGADGRGRHRRDLARFGARRGAVAFFLALDFAAFEAARVFVAKARRSKAMKAPIISS